MTFFLKSFVNSVNNINKIKFNFAISILIFLTLVSCASASTNISLGFWHPNTNPETYQPNWTALTHVANIDWKINADGTLIDNNADTNRHSNIIFSNAKVHGVKTLISAGTGSSNSDNILAYHQDEFVNSVADKINQTGAEGIILDFEYPSSTNSYTGTSNTPLFEEFMRKLYKKVKSINPEYTVAFCTPPYFEGVTTTFQNRNLSNYIDFVFIMGYDYHYNGPTGANSPYYNDSTRYGLRFSIAEQSKVYGKDKIVYGVPFYGYEYIATSNSPGASIQSVIGEFHLKNVDKKIQTYGKQWDSDSNTPYYYYLNDSSGTNKQVVLNNCDSLGSTTYDYHVNRTVEKGSYKSVATRNSSVFLVLRNSSRWDISSANYVNLDVKAPLGKPVVVRLFSGQDTNYINYRVIVNGNWQHITIPFKQISPVGRFNPASLYYIRVDLQNAVVGDTYYVDNITTSTEVDTYRQGWYDDAESLALKYQYIKDQDIRGIGFWALGFEPSNVWELIQPELPMLPASVLPCANFTTVTILGRVPFNVSFIDDSTGSPTSWSWNFGDGNTSTEKNPTHVYGKPGNYTVSLIVNNNNGKSATTGYNYIRVI